MLFVGGVEPRGGRAGTPSVFNPSSQPYLLLTWEPSQVQGTSSAENPQVLDRSHTLQRQAATQTSEVPRVTELQLRWGVTSLGFGKGWGAVEIRLRGRFLSAPANCG